MRSIVVGEVFTHHIIINHNKSILPSLRR